MNKKQPKFPDPERKWRRKAMRRRLMIVSMVPPTEEHQRAAKAAQVRPRES